MLQTFFDTGQVDASHYTYQPLGFDVGLGLPELAKILLGIVLGVIILLAALAWFVVRRLRRRRANHSGNFKSDVSHQRSIIA
ncbi:MAG: hypothetical protein PVH65_09320 [Chloroflexota bacterium]|jgi:uncharacterized membrane protein